MTSNESLASVARSLKKAGIEDVVFVDGAIVGLLITDSLAPPPRFTDDVDVVVTTSTRKRYNLIEERLLLAGHTQAQDGPICRWIVDGVKVDLMPTDERILGFSNRWYAPLTEAPIELQVIDESLKVASAPYLVATKLEAFGARGEGDHASSRDIEDIIILVDGRAELVREIENSEPTVRRYIVEEFRALLSSDDFRVSIPAHMLPDEASQARAELVLARLVEISEISV